MKIDHIEGRIIVVPDQLAEFRASEQQRGEPLHVETEYSSIHHASQLTAWPKARHGDKMDLFLLKVVTDEGLEGHCFSMDCHSYAMAHYVRDRLKALKGQDPSNIDRIWHILSRIERTDKTPVYLQAFLDVALWDLQAKRADLPLYQLLGGHRDRVLAYASALTLGSLEAYWDMAKTSVEQGYKAIKIHITGDHQLDIEVARTVREAAGDDIRLMYDASGVYDYEQALMVGRELDKLNFFWYEEPVRDFYKPRLRQLRSKLNVPLNVGERQAETPYEMVEHLLQGSADMIHGGWPFKGGISALLKIANFCELLGAKFQVHTPGLPSLQLACALKNSEFYELILPPQVFHYCSKDPPLEPDREGYVYPPDRPGIGWNLDWDMIEAHTVEVI